MLLGFYLFGLFFFYWGNIQLCKIKADAFSDGDYKIPTQSLTIFSSDTKGIVLVGKKEILANGKLYDIVRTKINNGKTLYYALSDEEEDTLVLDLTDWEKNNSQEKSMPGKTMNVQLDKFFTLKKYPAPLLVCSSYLSGHRKIRSDFFLYKSPFINIFSPPPNNFLS